MKHSILMSINPEFADAILDGSKKYEYRKVAAKQDISSIIIYETSPVKKIVAEAEVAEVIACTPEELWEKTKDGSGITKGFFDAYFSNRSIAYAYRLGKVTLYKEPMALADFGIAAAPRSFVYV